MRRWILLILALALALLPLFEFYDRWERPWDGGGSEIVLTLLLSALAVAFAFVLRLFPDLLVGLRKACAHILQVSLVCQIDPARHRAASHPILTPLRI